MTAIVKSIRYSSAPAVIAFGGLLIMSIVICYAFAYGEFFEEGAMLVDMSWGMVTLVDLYLGLLFFSFWIMSREDNKIVALGWCILILLLGNLLSCVYILKAAYESEGSVFKFWMGKNIDVDN